ncbi:MAG: hypothetical protein U0610_32425 [bacterium]
MTLEIAPDRRFVEDPTEPFFWADFLARRPGDDEQTQILVRFAVADFRALQARLGWDDSRHNNLILCESVLRAAVACGFWDHRLDAREHWPIVEAVVTALERSAADAAR